MYGKHFSSLLLSTAVLLTLNSRWADAQIVQTYPGGGVAVRAPFVRVNVDPWGRTSVRAPFVAVDDPGAVRVGPQRRLARRQWRAERRAALQQQEAQSFGQVETPSPTPAQAPSLPSAEEMADMDLTELVSTLRDLSRLFQDSLTKFDDPSGWQQYLAIPDDALGTPGMDEVALRLDVLQKQLERYQKVSEGGKFAKIAAMPSFMAAHAALELVVERFSAESPALVDPAAEDQWESDPGPVTTPRTQEPLPVPPRPEPRNGERSILKRG